MGTPIYRFVYIGLITLGPLQGKVWMPPKRGEEVRLDTFRNSLQAILHYQACCHTDGGADQFVLINAWNEWAEGMALEPSDVYQLKFLQALNETKVSFTTCLPQSLLSANETSNVQRY